MIKSVTVINDRDEQLTMELTEPWKTGLCIESITGIGPGKATINSTELASQDGSVFSSARVSNRNIVLTLILMEKPDIETVRHILYNFFPIKKEITLIFETDYRTVSINGFVEGNEPEIFAEQEKVQISVICTDPYFYASNKDYKLNGVDETFEFPFSNEMIPPTYANLTTNDGDRLVTSNGEGMLVTVTPAFSNPSLEFGEIVSNVSDVLVYDGDVESGITASISFSGPVTNFWISNMSTYHRMNFNTAKVTQIFDDGNYGIIDGDQIFLSTHISNRYLLIRRNGVYKNGLSILDKMTDWIMLQTGKNKFAYGADNGDRNMVITIQSYVKYSGV